MSLASDPIPMSAPDMSEEDVRDRLGAGERNLPVTKEAARRTVALPFRVNMTEEQVGRVVDALRGAREV